MTHFAAVAFALLIICACCALPAFAQDTTAGSRNSNRSGKRGAFRFADRCPGAD